MKTDAEYQRAWRSKNKDRADAAQAAYRAAHKAEAKAYLAAWRVANQEKIKAYARAYVQPEREAKQAQYYRDHKAEKNSKRLLKVYGLTPAEHEKLLSRSGNCCEICGEKEKEASRRLAVDHCHATGEVRGLLCGACNRALGHAESRSDWFRKATEYLTKPRILDTY